MPSLFPPLDDCEDYLTSAMELDCRNDVYSSHTMPKNWEMAYTDLGEQYFIDHNSGTTHWSDPRPRLAENTLSVHHLLADSDSIASGSGSELPFGWECVNDPDYGTYYVDHVNKKTQYEKPGSSRGYVFTRDPSQLKFEIIPTRILKGPRGLGLTLIGNDDDSNGEEFLQIKSIVQGGPAWKDGRLQPGDVLVYINNHCVLGAYQQEAISLFKSIPLGQKVTLRICRGYPLVLPSSSDVLTTNAYTEPNVPLFISSSNYHPNPPTSSGTAGLAKYTITSDNHHPVSRFSLNVVKSPAGFGFTIADSPFGQRVKAILDAGRCQGLEEGDILISVNQMDVLQLNHAQVVDVLRDCLAGALTTLVVHRGPKGPPQVRRHESARNRPVSYQPGLSLQGVPIRRSKTPTAEIGFGTPVSREQVEPTLKPRSKTPGPSMSSSYLGDHNQETNQLQPSVNRMDQSSFHSANFQGPVHPLHSSASSTTYINTNHVTSVPNISSSTQNYQPVKTTLSDAGPSITGLNGYITDKSMFPTSQIQLEHYSERNNVSPIYENLPMNSCSDVIGINSSNHMLHGSRSRGFLLGTPDYVPAKVWNTQGGQAGRELHVNLMPSSSGFGFRILGGSEEGTPVRVGEIMPIGPAMVDGRLQTGDELLSINSESVIKSSHAHAIALMNRAQDVQYAKLVVRRRHAAIGRSLQQANAQTNLNLRDSDFPRSYSEPLCRNPPQVQSRPCPQADMFNSASSLVGSGLDNGSLHVKNSLSYPYDVQFVRGESEGFGVVISTPLHRTGSAIDRIIANSPAARCGALKVGDKIVAVNGQDILNMYHGDIVKLIKDCGRTLTLTVGVPDQHISKDPFQKTTSAGPLQYGAVGCFIVELRRGAKGYGFSIRGGREFASMPLFVLRIADGGPAHEDGRLAVGDQLIEINGTSTYGMTHSEAIDMVTKMPQVSLLVKRDIEAAAPEIP